MNFLKIKHFPEAVFLIILLFLSCGGVEDLYNNKNTVKAYVDVCFEDVNFLIKIIQG